MPGKRQGSIEHAAVWLVVIAFALGAIISWEVHTYCSFCK